MRRGLIAGLVVLGLAAGCTSVAQSPLNPFNWFGGGQQVARVAAVDEIADPRPLMDQITRLAVEPTLNGAIVRATGLPPTQGYYDGELVPLRGDGGEAGTLDYEFRAFPPSEPTRVSTPQSREVVVGLSLSRQDLEGVRQIRVTTARNSRAVRR